MIIHDVEQRSDEWHALRAGMPTASEFSKVVTSEGKPSKQALKYAYMLAAEAFAGKPVDAWEGNIHTERGRLLEDDAIGLYEFTNDCKVERVGFVTDDDCSMGCSPDGFVGEDGLVEVKCLKAENHIDAILHSQIKDGRCPPDYRAQAQGQMAICGRAWCDLVFFHPELPPLTIRQEPDPDFVKALMEGIAGVRRERDSVLAVLRRHAGHDTLSSLEAEKEAV